MTPLEAGKIILINGTSSAGKSTLAKALQSALDEPFCYYASDQLADAGFRSRREHQQRQSPTERERFFDGFHRSIPAFAIAGNNLIVEHIVEEQSWADDLRPLLAPFHPYWVGVHAPLNELIRREQARGDRTIGESLYHLKTHSFCRYDIEVDSTLPLADQVEQLRSGWLSHVKLLFGSRT